MNNRLQFESSPYLLQHAQNPVDWYPWGEVAFERAKTTNKPVLVSIGYAACHWCHVMEHESFEDEAVATIMNEHFVCIKVDREEHPDVDHLYMDALQAISGGGGWPLNMFVTPDKQPFYGGTYFPPKAVHGRSSWTEILMAIHQAWTQKPEEVALQANQLLQHLSQVATVETAAAGASSTHLNMQDLYNQLQLQADTSYGGFGGAPKFPGTMSLQFLLNYYHTYKDAAPEQAEKALQHLELSLDKMIAGGVYDQLGGGFSRYATDRQWLVPHFEKMLYDNALLLQLLCAAYLVTKKENYRQTIQEIVDFCERELKDNNQEGFFSALDADSEGVEGKFYTWTYEEWASVLPEIHPAVASWWGISPEGNWEHTNILNRNKELSWVIQNYGLTAAAFQQELQEAKDKLWALRAKRIRPATDDKILLSWNALMNVALQQAAIVLEQPALLQQATRHMNWMRSVFCQSPQLMQHVWCKGQARIPAKLDDYAYLIQALIQLGATTGQEDYLHQAFQLTEAVQQDFSDEESSFFYFSAQTQKDIIVRKMEIYDGATPSANAVMQRNLNELGQLFSRNDWLLQSSEMLAAMQSMVGRHPSSFGFWANQLLEAEVGHRQVVVAGANAEIEVQALLQSYHPFVMKLAATTEDSLVPALQHKLVPRQLGYYLCKQFTCLAPVYDRMELLQLLARNNA